jgi:hypothetical protein
VDDPLQIGLESLKTMLTGQPYNETLTATGGFGSYAWAISSGELPHGIILQTQAGQVTGTPVQVGSVRSPFRSGRRRPHHG